MPDEAQQGKHEPEGDQEIAEGLLRFELDPKNFTRAMRQANRRDAEDPRGLRGRATDVLISWVSVCASVERSADEQSGLL